MTSELQPNGSPVRGRDRLANLIPNMMTLGAVCVGLTAVRFALDARIDLAVIALVVAMVMDGLDGGWQGALNSTSRIGKELDSLADFFNFGIAPGLILHLALFNQSTRVDFTWVAIMLVAACCAYRLARFNASEESETAQTFEGSCTRFGVAYLNAGLSLFAGIRLCQPISSNDLDVPHWLRVPRCLAGTDLVLKVA